jgi:hypothetical protein
MRLERFSENPWMIIEPTRNEEIGNGLSKTKPNIHDVMG